MSITFAQWAIDQGLLIKSISYSSLRNGRTIRARMGGMLLLLWVACYYYFYHWNIILKKMLNVYFWNAKHLNWSRKERLAKIIIAWSYFRKTLQNVWQGSKYRRTFEYFTVLNMLLIMNLSGFRILTRNLFLNLVFFF